MRLMFLFSAFFVHGGERGSVNLVCLCLLLSNKERGCLVIHSIKRDL